MSIQKSLSVAACLAAATTAQYVPLTVSVDGADAIKQYRSQNWSTATTSATYQVNIGSNNNVFLHDAALDGQYYAYKPGMIGGALQFDVDLSQLPCGCVAGVYAVKLNDVSCSEDSKTGKPMCPSIDIMQANPFGFQMAANPCANGTCDAVSQCMNNMRDQGVTKYGSGAYGPGGSYINTNLPFTVKTEFLSTTDYASLWGIRTRLT